MSENILKTNCHFCGYLCGLLATVKDGRVINLEPDPSRYPYDERILAGCHRWKKNLDILDGADRVNYPLKRTGERGSGQWMRVSWDEALDDIANRLSALKQEYGAGVLASMIGGPHTSFWPLHRFMTLFGSPNNMGIGQICWNPRIWMDVITFGWTVEADIRPETGCVFIWGTNPAESDNSVFWRTLLKVGKSADTKLVVIDPRLTRTAKAADLWLSPKPGTDCTLALSMLNVIIEHELYDKQFVDEWCHGFDELVEHIKPYTPEYAESICGIAAEDICKAASWFASLAPSALISGRGIDQVGQSVAPTHRAICCLRAITGNIDVPGSCVIAEGSDFVSEADLELTLQHMDELSKLCLNTKYTPLQCYEGYKQVEALTEKAGRKLPVRYLTSAHPDLVLRAMETSEPYAVRALIVEATNPLLTYADTHRVYNALMGLDLIVVLDYYMTPTAQIADYVLPSAAAIERPTFQAHGGVGNIAYGGAAAVKPYYERKTDYDIFRALGIRLGQKENWRSATFEQACSQTLAPAGMSWEEYCEQGLYFRPPGYMKHLMTDDEMRPFGFATTTGKIELASELLPKLGGQRLPESGHARQLCSSEFITEKECDNWMHLYLITGGRKQPYNASMYMNIPSFRKMRPYPEVEMNEVTANRLGVKLGDSVILATDNGQAAFKVVIASMADDLIHADYGWWHPEWGDDGRLGGMWESNINCLTSCSLDQSEALIGTWSYNALDCMAKKLDKVLSWDEPSTDM
ncbi:molybdopterin-dependent oxidoreductase [Adlercreutzia sp. ZJ304]|uniref:molybdopterin-containing oxidoreductase family protein n=1 Tax=Adlercreutzia sp. ZJ304 TaxID=2709791 RepID=UPI0013E9F953|nr:molybdopterin-dependent oxidoreductase [Adlercreutzia sp. ZJ304]